MTPINQQIQTAVFRLYDWQRGGTSFTCQLYSLMSKADPSNFAKLVEAFPIEGCALIAWRNSSNEKQFFRMYGIEASA